MPQELLKQADTWIFDLDNTLYPAECNLFVQVDHRMGQFISALLDIDREEARAIQKRYFRTYGTTLRGLMDNHGVDPHDFLGYVHNIDYSPIDRNSAMDAALDRLPGRKLVFTNGTVAHADAVLDRLGIARHFDAIFDITHADFVPKPNPEPYDRFVESHAIAPRSAVMVEDIAKNLEHPHRLGMQTVWVRTDHHWSHDGAGGDYVHHTVDDLTRWLCDFVEEL